MSERDYVFHKGSLLGLHRSLHTDVFCPDEDAHLDMWKAIPDTERDALLMLTLVSQHTGEWPSAPLCVEIARVFRADAGVVCAGWGYLPRRAATPEERNAYELCRHLATGTYNDVKHQPGNAALRRP